MRHLLLGAAVAFACFVAGVTPSLAADGPPSVLPTEDANIMAETTAIWGGPDGAGMLMGLSTGDIAQRCGSEIGLVWAEAASTDSLQWGPGC